MIRSASELLQEIVLVQETVYVTQSFSPLHRCCRHNTVAYALSCTCHYNYNSCSNVIEINDNFSEVRIARLLIHKIVLVHVTL